MNQSLAGLAALGSTVLALAGALAPAVRPKETPMSPEEHLMDRVGAWDCAMSVWPGPGDPLTALGSEVGRALGNHVLADYASASKEVPFEGHGVTSWDAAKERFVTIWVDTIATVPAILEGTYDAESHTVTFVGEAAIHGQQMRIRQVVRREDADHRTLEMFVTPPGGEETRSMRIEYTRRR